MKTNEEIRESLDGVANEPNMSHLVTVNIHRLYGDECGFEISTRYIKNDRGLYFVSSGATKAEAMRAMQDELERHYGQRPQLIVGFEGYRT